MIFKSNINPGIKYDPMKYEGFKKVFFKISSLFFLLAIGCINTLQAQTNEPSRPVPYPVFETLDFSNAVERGTRTRSGRTGSVYWQQNAIYSIEAKLDPAANLLTGYEKIQYYNNSPDTLKRIAVYLRQNVFAPGAVRNIKLPVTGGMSIAEIKVNGTLLFQNSSPAFGPGYFVDGTIAWILLSEPLEPGGDIQLAIRWSHSSPPAPGDGRQGQDGEVFFMGYWYPQLAVYDDVSGWVTDQYMSMSEFYMGYADYDVRLSVPQGWLIGATGVLQNPGVVLSHNILEKLEKAKHSDKVVQVVTQEDIEAGTSTNTGSKKPWHFSAKNVRDFAWATSDRYLWDATRALVGQNESGKTILIHNFYRDIPEASAWKEGARYNRLAVEFFSRYFWPYPYPQMTSVEGILDGGGMEYPMLTVIQSYTDSMRLAGNLMHEIGHMWFPMQVGSDEKRYTWMDEGLVQFSTAQGTEEVYNYDRWQRSRMSYINFARNHQEIELMRHGDTFQNQAAYWNLPYNKTTMILRALRAMVGNDLFLKGLREYGRRWINKHPQPYDFFNTINEVIMQDLSWFWRTWFYETWTLDQAISSVTIVGDSVEITISDLSLAPMPVYMAITHEGGKVEQIEVPVKTWLDGNRQHTVRVSAKPAVLQVEIDPENNFPDINRKNQFWKQ